MFNSSPHMNTRTSSGTSSSVENLIGSGNYEAARRSVDPGPSSFGLRERDKNRDTPPRPLSARNLTRLLHHAEHTNASLSTRLSNLQSQVNNYRGRDEQMLQHFRTVNERRIKAEEDALHAGEELKLWKNQYARAQAEISRAQGIVDGLEAQLSKAMQELSKKNSEIRKLTEEKLIIEAREDGRRQGLREGLEVGFGEGKRKGSDRTVTSKDRMNGKTEKSVIERQSPQREKQTIDRDIQTRPSSTHSRIVHMPELPPAPVDIEPILNFRDSQPLSSSSSGSSNSAALPTQLHAAPTLSPIREQPSPPHSPPNIRPSSVVPPVESNTMPEPIPGMPVPTRDIPTTTSMPATTTSVPARTMDMPGPAPSMPAPAERILAPVPSMPAPPLSMPVPPPSMPITDRDDTPPAFSDPAMHAQNRRRHSSASSQSTVLSQLDFVTNTGTGLFQMDSPSRLSVIPESASSPSGSAIARPPWETTVGTDTFEPPQMMVPNTSASQPIPTPFAPPPPEMYANPVIRQHTPSNATRAAPPLTNSFPLVPSGSSPRFTSDSRVPAYSGQDAYSGRDVSSERDMYSGKDAYSGRNTYGGRDESSGKDAYSGRNVYGGKDEPSRPDAYSGRNTYAGRDEHSGKDVFAGKNAYTGQDVYKRPDREDESREAHIPQSWGQPRANGVGRGEMHRDGDGGQEITFQFELPSRSPSSTHTFEEQRGEVISKYQHLPGHLNPEDWLPQPRHQQHQRQHQQGPVIPSAYLMESDSPPSKSAVNGISTAPFSGPTTAHAVFVNGKYSGPSSSTTSSTATNNALPWTTEAHKSNSFVTRSKTPFGAEFSTAARDPPAGRETYTSPALGTGSESRGMSGWGTSSPNLGVRGTPQIGTSGLGLGLGRPTTPRVAASPSLGAGLRISGAGEGYGTASGVAPPASPALRAFTGPGAGLNNTPRLGGLTQPNAYTASPRLANGPVIPAVIPGTPRTPLIPPLIPGSLNTGAISGNGFYKSPMRRPVDLDDPRNAPVIPNSHHTPFMPSPRLEPVIPRGSPREEYATAPIPPGVVYPVTPAKRQSELGFATSNVFAAAGIALPNSNPSSPKLAASPMIATPSLEAFTGPSGSGGGRGGKGGNKRGRGRKR